MNALNLHFVAQMSVERLLNCLAEGTAIALFAWLVLRLVGRRNSGTRFAVWFCALLAIAVAPFVEMSTSPGVAFHSASAAFTMPRAWSLYLFGAWAAIAAIGLVRVAAGLWHLRAIRKSCAPVDVEHLDPVVIRTLGGFQSARRVQLCVSETLRVPTAIGLVNPAVVIPSWALHELSAAELNAVVLHELAHLHRWDDWTNLAQKVLRALFFFHPAVWWVESRLSLEREMACDDLVLATTENPQAYAACLLSLAERNLLQRGIALAQAAVGRMRQTSLRVLEILDVRRPKTVSVWKPAPWVVAGFSIVCLASAAHAPKLVAFGDAAGVQMSASTAASSTPDSQSLHSQSYVPRVVPVSFVERSNRGFTPSAPKAYASPGNGPALRPMPANAVSHMTRKTAATSASALPALQKTQSPSVQPGASSVRVVRTSVAESHTFAITQQATFVVIQDEYGNAIPVVWHVTVWRVTVVPQAPRQIAPEALPKST